MRKRYLSCVCFLLLVVPLGYANQITIYEDGTSVVRESRRTELKSGKNTIYVEDLPLAIDRSSLKVEMQAKWIKLLERVFEFNLVSSDLALQKSIGKEVEIVRDDGTLHLGQLISFDAGSIAIREESGKISILTRSKISEMRLPDVLEGVIVRPRLKLLAESSTSGNADVKLTYFTSGIGWEAVYIGELAIDERSILVSGSTSITNTCGIDYKGCEIKLISGSLHRAPRAYFAREAKVFEAAPARGGFEEAPLFEYHEYKLDGKVDLGNQTTTQIDLFQPTSVSCSKEFVFDHDRGEKVQVAIEFENTKDAGLGLPLPAGRFRVFKKGSGGTCEFVGEDNIGHIAKGEKVRLYIGDAFDIEAKREQIDFTKISDRVFEETFKITLANHKEEKVKIKVLERIYGDWSIKQSSHPYEKIRFDQIEFKVDVPAGGEALITYTVRRKS